MVKVSVIIVNYNGKRFLKDCFESLRKQIFKDFEVIFVDNGSSDNSVEFVKKNYPKVRVIENESNLGFAEGNNVGYRVAKGKYVVLLNNDTIVDKNWLKELVDVAEKDKSIAIVGAVSFPFGTDLNKVKIGRYNYTLSITGATVSANGNRTLYIDGASCLIRKSIFKELFDKDYFCYGEDIYLGWLANLRGYKTVYGNAKYLHFGSGTTQNSPVYGKNKSSVLAVYYVERNTLMNFLIFYEFKTLMEILPLIILTGIIKLSEKMISFDLKRAGAIIRAYLWVALNIGRIIEKRKKIQGLRKIKDNEILRLMSYKMFDENRRIAGFINKFAKAYIRLIGIRTIENER